MEGILQHLQRYLETPSGVTNLRLEVIALNKEDYYICLDILGELRNVYTSTPSKSSNLLPKPYISNLLSLVFINMQIILPVFILKYIFVVNCDKP